MARCGLALLRPLPGLVLILALVGCTGPATATSPDPSAPSGATWDVTEVVDGDTIHVAQGTVTDTVRLVGINAPEHGECWADQARMALVSLVDDRPVWLQRDVSDRDRYGRMLRYVTDASGRDVGGLLIDGGHAIARAYPPDTGRDAEYHARQEVARAAGIGSWARDACGPPPSGVPSGVFIRIEVHPDAAGDDALNLDDEWVRFSNLGVDAIDLEGWVVRDESSSHRYHFGPLVLTSAAMVTLYSGCGTDSDAERFWCVSGSAVWNNTSDTVFLLDPPGNVIARLSYPTPGASPGTAVFSTATAPP